MICDFVQVLISDQGVVKGNVAVYTLRMVCTALKILHAPVALFVVLAVIFVLHILPHT